MNIRLIIFSGIVSAVTMFASDEISHGIGGNPSVCEERAPESNESKIWSFDDCIDWALEINTDLRRNLFPSFRQTRIQLRQKTHGFLPSDFLQSRVLSIIPNLRKGFPLTVIIVHTV